VSELFKSIEIDSVFSAIKRACKWRHDSYYWSHDTEWKWIKNELHIVDAKIEKLTQQIAERDELILELKKQLEEVYEQKLYSRRKLEQENKMMQECLEIIKEDKYEATPWLTVETGSAKRAKECLAKLTEGEK
jgi:uncharacterized protein (DUF3084 family)